MRKFPATPTSSYVTCQIRKTRGTLVVDISHKNKTFSKLQKNPRNFIPKMLNIIRRGISTTAAAAGKHNFRKFLLYNKRGTRIFKRLRAANPEHYPDMPIDKRGVRDTGVTRAGQYHEIAEKIPDLIVPSLEGCKMKPYVSYRAPDVIQSEFTSQDLFNAVYAQKVIDDCKGGNLNEDGTPKEPSEAEKLTPEEAWIRARKTGSDMF